VGHCEWVQAGESLEVVQKKFAGHNFEFMAVMDKGRLLGLCSREKVGMVLGARFGFAMNSKKPVREFMLPEMTVVGVSQPLTEVLTLTCSRPHETLYDDVPLVGAQGALVGIIFSQTLVRLQNSLLQEKIKELDAKNAQLEGDLHLAREIQLAMLPAQFPEIAGGGLALRFEQRYLPAGVVSGDFFCVQKISDSVVGVFVCDVMGHGVRSAFVTATLRALIEEMRPFAADPGELLSHVNTGLMSILKAMDDTLYATAFYLAVDAGQGVVRYAKAGHPDPLVLNRDTGDVRVLQSPVGVKGPALGIHAAARYGTSEARLEAGDLLVVFTDGIAEVFDAQEREFGSSGMISALKSRRRQPVAVTLDGLLEDSRRHAGNGGFDDDICLVALEAVSTEIPQAVFAQ
jgi:serine phosphatase RsbU (regulator of sigma subunit)